MGIRFLDKIGDEYWVVDLKWAPPIKWTGGKIDLEDEAWENSGLYRFDRAYPSRKGPRELIYIGIACKQDIATRVNQHRWELPKWERRGDLWISYTIPEVKNGNCTPMRYGEIEHLLTYLFKPKEPRQKKKSAPKGSYRITNLGYRGILSKKISYPVAEMIK